MSIDVNLLHSENDTKIPPDWKIAKGKRFLKRSVPELSTQ